MPEDASSAALHGLVELRAGHALTWEEARQQADDEAGGLPTCDDLRAAGVSAGDGIDLWMPVQRADGRKGDYCQIGNHPHNKERYISHIDAYGPTSWHTNTDAAGWRPGPNSTSLKGVFFAVSGKGPDTLDAALSMLSAALSGGSSSTRLAKLSATAIELVHKADSQAIEAAVEKLLSKEGPLTARFFIDDCARAPDRPRIALALPRPLS